MIKHLPTRFVSLVTALATAACSGSSSPTAPTAPAQNVLVQSIQSTPAGTGVQFNTDFQFDAQGTFPSGTQFTWQYGDGSTGTTTAPRGTHIYTQTGNFTVTVEARLGANSSVSTRQVSVRSLVGRWLGTVTGHTTFPANRQIPIPSFELVVAAAPAPAAGARFAALSATWADEAGCRENRAGFINQSFTFQPTASVGFGVESLLCNDRSDFYMTGLANATFDRVEGTCAPFGGPNCRFQMVRQ
jgi:hypothetical protein